MTEIDAARHLRRATLGFRPADLAAAQGLRVDQWVDAEFAKPHVPNQMRDIFGPATPRLPGFPTGLTVETGWTGLGQFLNWKYHQDHRLITRLVYCMQEFFSVGGAEAQYGFSRPFAVLWDIFENEIVTGNFRNVLRRVSLSQPMSQYLTYWRNSRTIGGVKPDENYAREIMQLYSIGLWMRNLDGTIQTQSEVDPSDPRYVPGGTEPVPTYAQADIENVARIFTGWHARRSYDGGATLISLDASWNDTPQRGSSDARDELGNTGWWAQLRAAPSFHESTLPKVALQGRVNIPVGTDGMTSLDLFLDALVAHPSCGPFLALSFIRLLTSSNPSRAYVARVASVFRNDGTGQIGNLRAFFRAILTDQEALAAPERGLTIRVPSFYEQVQAIEIAHSPPLTAEGAPSASGTGAYPGSTSFEFGHRGFPFLDPFIPGFQPSVFRSYPAEFQPQGPVAAVGQIMPEAATFGAIQVTRWLNATETWQRAGNRIDAQDLTDVATTGNRAALLQRLNMRFAGGNAPSSLMAALTSWLATRTDNSTASLVETYRSLVAAFALEPAGYTRN